VIGGGDAPIFSHHAVFHPRAFDNGKDIQGQPFVRKQLKESGQTGARPLVVIMVMRFRVERSLLELIQPLSQVAEQSGGPIKFKIKAAELDMAGLLGEHNFEEFVVVGLPLEAVDERREKYRATIAGGDIVA
jgi:hypothetical protein